ncbi:hypothetical protein PR202_gb15564 [Eleusine coracana subsp. coracana]|uniref:Uncharacterized protein n=1 Tax=Eleusine coracana subsp. coracana TaxID=191504 RepID=A0AAV5EVY9_ELECO|nr:hypothetical protein PR202_gb15564 [Eleusine coracana subsp. coracana]
MEGGPYEPGRKAGTGYQQNPEEFLAEKKKGGKLGLSTRIAPCHFESGDGIPATTREAGHAPVALHC